MREVWNEIIQGLSVKGVLITLLSIITFSFVMILCAWILMPKKPTHTPPSIDISPIILNHLKQTLHLEREKD